MKPNTVRQNMASDREVKVDVIAGFSGAGKTTWFNRICEALWIDEVMVYVRNEFGKEVPRIPPGAYSVFQKDINSGCICCTGSLPFIQAISDMISEYKPDRLIIEVAETSELEGVINLLTKDLRDSCILDHIFFIVDATSFQKRELISHIFLRHQLLRSPVCILNRGDRLSEEELGNVMERILSMNPDCFIETRRWKELTKTDMIDICNKSKISSIKGSKKIRYIPKQLVYKE